MFEIKKYCKFYFIVACMAVALLLLVGMCGKAEAQVSNPGGFDFTVTTSGVSDHAYVVSLRRVTNQLRVNKATFVTITASDSCRVVFNNDDLDSKLWTFAASDKGNVPGFTSDYATYKYVPLAADITRQFVIDSDYLTFYIYGDARTVAIKGQVEYHD